MRTHCNIPLQTYVSSAAIGVDCVILISTGHVSHGPCFLRRILCGHIHNIRLVPKQQQSRNTGLLLSRPNREHVSPQHARQRAVIKDLLLDTTTTERSALGSYERTRNQHRDNGHRQQCGAQHGYDLTLMCSCDGPQPMADGKSRVRWNGIQLDKQLPISSSTNDSYSARCHVTDEAHPGFKAYRMPRSHVSPSSGEGVERQAVQSVLARKGNRRFARPASHIPRPPVTRPPQHPRAPPRQEVLPVSSVGNIFRRGIATATSMPGVTKGVLLVRSSCGQSLTSSSHKTPLCGHDRPSLQATKRDPQPQTHLNPEKKNSPFAAIAFNSACSRFCFSWKALSSYSMRWESETV